jgi:hypothetical protein
MKLPFWLDSNSLIESKDRWYPFSQVPKFWSFTGAEIENGSIRAPHAVYKELVAGNDQLAEWVRNRKANLSVLPDECIFQEMKKIADHVQKNYKRNQYEEFLIGADPWLIATAKCMGGTIITGESKSRKQKIRIPTICNEFGVPFGEIWAVVHHFNWTLG